MTWTSVSPSWRPPVAGRLHKVASGAAGVARGPRGKPGQARDEPQLCPDRKSNLGAGGQTEARARMGNSGPGRMGHERRGNPPDRKAYCEPGLRSEERRVGKE